MKKILSGKETFWSSTLRRILPWFLLATLPVMVNCFVWKKIVVPAQNQMATVRQMESLVAVNPKLEAAVSRSSQLLDEWERRGFTSEDPEAVVRLIREAANAKGVKIEEINRKELADSKATVSIMPLELKVSGNYMKLADWMGRLEGNQNLQIEHCSLTPSKESGVGNDLDITLRVILRNP